MEGTTEVKANHIVVLDRGFVYVGQVREEGDKVVIENARNVRRWGTDKGLGQLALEGPQPNTQLDNCGTVIASKRAVIHQLVCKTNW